MATKSQNQIIEAEVCFRLITDVDPNMGNDSANIEIDNVRYIISVRDFFGWMFESSRIDNYENGTVISKGYAYPYFKFWYDNTITGNLDQDLLEYAKSGAKLTPENPDWLSDIRTPQPAGPEVPSATSREHAEAEAAELEPFRAAGWVEFIENTKA